MSCILCVVGARPNFMKMSPILNALCAEKDMKGVLVHTGQHYDFNMSDIFFQELDLPRPSEFLGVGSGTHSEQIARVMLAFEEVIPRYKPDIVVVVGDVNSTLACALTSVKSGVGVAHVEAGLRSYDRSMPEEINRIATDAIADLLLTPSRDADANLLKEGIDSSRIRFVGNVMIDTLLKYRDIAHQHSNILSDLGLASRTYALITLHRPSNVDAESSLQIMVHTVLETQKRLQTVWPLHPRTKQKLQNADLLDALQKAKVLICEPLGYLDFLKLMDSSRAVLTDSGGIQEETTVLGIPCLTLRNNTERPITILEGTNHLAGTETKTIIRILDSILSGEQEHTGRLPEGWDGKAATRVVIALKDFLNIS